MKVPSIAFFPHFRAHPRVTRGELGRVSGQRSAGRPGGTCLRAYQPSPRGQRPGFSVNTHNLIGGLTVAVLALLVSGVRILCTERRYPGTHVSRFSFGRIAAAVGFVPVHAPRDFYGGIGLVMLADAGLDRVRRVTRAARFAFGPGTAPRLFSYVLAALGAAVAVGGVFTEGPPIEKYKIRGPSLVIIAILSFAAMIRPLGLVPATFLAFMISILGSTEMRWIESTIAAGSDDFFLRVAVRLPASACRSSLAALLLTRG